ncbi:M13 family metallopeptidase [Undibacterium sp. Ji22W]|uniref:M13 family metallopeptidase n=1 Tax=Undibacterium sp. Ji22W TaxID=3413038 RepID=UPI003BF39F1A
MRSHKLSASALLLALCLSSNLYAQNSGIKIQDLDSSVRIQDDLYQAANGTWLKRATIPSSKSELYAVETTEIVKQRIQNIVTKLAKHQHEKGNIEQKIGDYFHSYVDLKTIDTKGTKALFTILKEIDAIQNLEQLAAWQGRTHGIIKTPIWLWGGFADLRDPNLNRAFGMQGGLGLPDRDYYLNLQDTRFATARAAYLNYLIQMGQLIKLAHPKQTAQAILNLESKIAQAHTASQDAMNPANIQTLTAQQLETLAPGFPWAKFLADAKIPEQDSINYMQAKTAIGIAKLYQEIPLEDWKNYFKMRIVNEAAPVLPKPYRSAHFTFQQQNLQGISHEEARTTSGITVVSEALNEALSKTYVEQYFPAENKTKISRMFDQLRQSAKQNIEQVQWMNASTKQEALAKLDKLKAKIAYPDSWRDYTKLEIIAGDTLGNQHRAKRFKWERQAAMSGTKVDRSLWMMAPIEVNAYYDPSLNEINLPAAFLQAPFFDQNADDASNYGKLGAFIAHEISHGFDSNGSQFDSLGVMRNWWTKEDSEHYHSKELGLIDFYNKLEILPGKNVNGKLTLPENMADILGLQIAFRAYQNTLNGNTSKTIDGLSGEKIFFLAYAQTWAVLRRDERSLQLLTSDPHSPNQVRSNATVMHVDGFHTAFGTKEGDKLYLKPELRFHLW